MAALNLLVTEQLDSKQLLVLFYFGILFYFILVYMHMYFSNIMDDYTLPPSYDGSLGILGA